MDTVIVLNSQFYSHFPRQIPKGSVNAEQVEIRLDKSWDGLTVFWHWKNLGTGVEKRDLLNDPAAPNDIPWEVLTDLGELRMGLVGLDGETVIKPTIWLTYGYVVDGVDPEAGSDPQPPTPSWEQQMVEQAEAAANAAKAAKETADNLQASADAGEFNGDPGPAGPPGKSPIIQDGNWWIWDVEAQEYRDTGVAASGGGLQVADYEHQGNQEIHFSSIDWATGVCDCTEPHNLTEPKKVLIVPNNWWDGTNYVGAGVVHIPIEWIVYTGNSIYVVPVDETRVKITGADKTTIIPVDTEDVSNTNLDATKFHVEIPIGFIISNLPVNVQTLRIFAFGFSGLMTYRYVQVLTDTKSGSTPRRVWPTTMLSVPRTGLSKCGYALPFWYDITVEAAANGTYFDISTLYLGQRQGYSSWIADKTKEDLSSPYAPASDNNAKYFTGIEIVNQDACYANHTIFRLYAKAVKE